MVSMDHYILVLYPNCPNYILEIQNGQILLQKIHEMLSIGIFSLFVLAYANRVPDYVRSQQPKGKCAICGHDVARFVEGS